MRRVCISLLATLLILGGVVFVQQREEIQNTQEDVPKSYVNTYLTTCAACHGERGEGNRETMAPAIAALPRWYIQQQIWSIHSGRRGTHPMDVTGAGMRTVLMSLDPEEIDEAVDYLMALPVPEVVHEIEGDLERGASLYKEHCMICHRFNGHGEQAFLSAPLTGLQDWYLYEQMKKFQNGSRGYHPDDELGAKMKQAASQLESDQDLRDIISYISTLSNNYPIKKSDSTVMSVDPDEAGDPTR
ncbi:hypothetical protein NT6N_29410 [Oceaniferula spumae]|uniref:Cytochrome c domain-containing protein n=1 Tax=Oceaniferula spumae TaxID=2979115 RepID=A0AAT9FPF8_9BACT